MKKTVIFALILLVVFMSLGFASAQSCGGVADQVILRLSSDTNAHAERGNAQNPAYSIEICYNDFNFDGTGGNDIFDTQGGTINPYSCGTNKVIRLSGVTNAHASAANVAPIAGYTDACFGDLICFVRSGCLSGETEILKMPDTTNAHLATVNSGSGYGFSVCCIKGGIINPPSGGCNNDGICDPGEDPVNCPLDNCQVSTECSDSIDNDGDGDIDFPSDAGCVDENDDDETNCGDGICEGGETSSSCIADCPVGGGAITLENPNWMDFSNPPNIITESNVGNSVKLYVETTNIPAGTTITFDIREDDGIAGTDVIKTGLTAQTDANGAAIVEWEITQADFDAASGNDNNIFPSTPELEVFFVASESGGENTQSPILLVSETQDTDDEPPNPCIGDDCEEPGDPSDPGGGDPSNPGGGGNNNVPVGLVHKGIYYKDTEIIFDASGSSDPEGPIDSFEWIIEYTNPVTGDYEVEFSSDLEYFEHSFATAGQRTITLKVTDSAGQSNEVQIAIVVVDTEPGVFSFINDPFHKEVVTVINRIVDFNAGHSYTVLTSGNSCTGANPFTLSCIAGICPMESENTPIISDCASGKIPVISGGVNPSPDYTDLIFNYETNFGFSFTGTESGSLTYGSSSTKENDKSLSLNLEYDGGGTIYNEKHKRVFTLGQCVNNGAVFLEVVNGKIADKHSTLNTPYCSGADGLPGEGGDDCCPVSPDPEKIYTCSLTGCVLGDVPDDGGGGGGGGNPLAGCGIFNGKQSECENAPEYVVMSDPLYDVLNCGKFIDGKLIVCSCVYDVPIGTGICSLAAFFDDDPSNPPGGGYPPGGGGGGIPPCVFSYDRSECTDGKIKITPSPVQGTCNLPEPYFITCGDFSLELGFFDYAQFIASAIIIFLIYLFVYLKKK